MNRILYVLKFLKYYIKQKNSHHISILKCVKAFFHGFTPDEYYIFNFDKNNIDEYLSEFKRLYYRKKINGEEYTAVLDNKLLFKLVASSDLIEISPVVCWKNNYLIFNEKNDIVNMNDILESMNGVFFIKPLSAGGGKGVLKISCKKNEYYIEEKLVTIKDIEQELLNRNSFILEKFVEQAQYSKDIYPFSTNTIRIITLQDKKGNINVVKAIHRFGTDISKPTDNFSRYGLACNIDLTEGILKECLWKNSNISIKHHPDTGKKITGIKIPRWDEIKQNVVDMHNEIKFLKFIAWDILLTDNNYVVVEANASCSADLLQIDEGIKKNKKIYELYKEIGAIK